MRQDTIFDNRDALLAKGEIPLRRDVLSIAEAGIRKAIPYESTKALVRVTGQGVWVGEQLYPQGSINHIYVVGAGKGAFPIAKALDEALGERIKKGVVVVKEGDTHRLSNISVMESSHPIPDERSIVAADRMIELLREAGEGDLVFAAVTGGSSALVNKPAGGITMEELRRANQMLLLCGAEIGKINAVRKHLCLLKGGRLVEYAQPATVITLTLDTAPPDMPWPDMCLPDPTTFRDAVAVLKSYKLWDGMPQSIRQRLEAGLEHPEMETLKSLDGMRHTLHYVADPRSACNAAAQRAKELGYTPHILSTTMEGEAKDVGYVHAGIANEIVRYGRPFQPPCALISGGETTVTIHGEPREGGPNQETALGFAGKLRVPEGVAFLSMDTDGTDGPGGIAGGLVDACTPSRLRQKGINLNQVFQQHASSDTLRTLGDAVLTGHTGTNVMNLRVVVIQSGKGETPPALDSGGKT